MRWNRPICLGLWLGLFVAGGAWGQTYQTFQLNDGQRLSARAINFKDNGVQLALEAGGYTNIAWGRLSQETLTELAKIKQAAPYATLFLDPPASSPTKTRKAEASLKPVPRMERPGAGNFFASPVMLFALFLIYVANLYAAYEISIYRRQPVALVCVVAAIAPIVGPALFLALPTRIEREETEFGDLMEDEPLVHQLPNQSSSDEASAGSASPAAPASAYPPAVTYHRGQYTFNRRFFETKLAAYLRVTPAESEKNMVIVVNSARGNYVGTRLVRLDANELYLHVKNGPASQDVLIPYNEISLVQVKHKDA